MNVQSFILLAIVLGAFVVTLRYVIRKNRKHPSCGGCSCCDAAGRCKLNNDKK
ncbi:MAG: FeoB-associated Cys-rich membrane protein [Bacteroidales bacterium]|nr:FeoB-associated Cys-rich membrane protein [Bacteroidales bacterium]